MSVKMTASFLYTEPNAVENLVDVPSGKTTSQFTVQWTRPDGDLDGYRLWVGSSGSYTSLGQDETSYRVTGRDPATQYRVQIAAVAGNTESVRRSLDVTTSKLYQGIR